MLSELSEILKANFRTEAQKTQSLICTSDKFGFATASNIDNRSSDSKSFIVLGNLFGNLKELPKPLGKYIVGIA